MQKSAKKASSVYLPIYPLSPDPALSDEEAGVYFDYLDAAFNESRVHNLAVTGGFGVGKSSVIRSYEAHRRNNSKKNVFKNHRKQGFLYISLGAFANQNIPDQADNPSTETVASIEHRLLLQIYSRFRRRDLPLSGFRLIQEESSYQRWITPVLVSLFASALVLLSTFKTLLTLFDKIKTTARIGTVAEFFLKYSEMIQLFLLLFVVGFTFVAANRLCAYLLTHFRLHSISVKAADSAELALEETSGESYLDIHSMELVYCLERLSNQIDGTIVVEDLDRFSSQNCLRILTNLREINYLVNLRLDRRGKWLRFVYVVSDQFLIHVEHAKFFDYILPVVPALNRRSSATIVMDKLKDIHRELSQDNPDVSVQPQFPHIEMIAPYLNDYRLQNTILNEYRILSRLYSKNSSTTREQEAEELFAFAVYKNVWPDDYAKICRDESEVFTAGGIKCPERVDNIELLMQLTDPSDPLLTLHSLYYAGYKEETIAERFYKNWQREDIQPEEIISDLHTIQAEDGACIQKVIEFFKERNIIQRDEKGYFCCDAQGNYIIKDLALYRAVIECVVRCGQKDNSWLFDRDYLIECIALLASLDETSDITLKNKLFDLTDVGEWPNIYNATTSKINGLRKISAEQLTELCRGIRPFPPHTKLIIGNCEVELTEDCSLIQNIREELKQQRNCVE